jgi:hypothetical protein
MEKHKLANLAAIGLVCFALLAAAGCSRAKPTPVATAPAAFRGERRFGVVLLEQIAGHLRLDLGLAARSAWTALFSS